MLQFSLKGMQPMCITSFKIHNQFTDIFFPSFFFPSFLIQRHSAPHSSYFHCHTSPHKRLNLAAFFSSKSKQMGLTSRICRRSIYLFLSSLLIARTSYSRVVEQRQNRSLMGKSRRREAKIVHHPFLSTQVSPLGNLFVQQNCQQSFSHQEGYLNVSCHAIRFMHQSFLTRQ